MNLDSLQPVLDWTRAHQDWAELAVFGIACGESLAVVGLILPGALLLFGAGALVAMGALDLWPTLLWAALGAMAGDGLSFWFGRHYQQRLRVMWPLRRYPELVARGVDFFYRHGGKSILLGRFIGPLRAFIPAVAGMLGMPVGRYLAINLISALLWSPAHILPGVVFGASLDLAGEVAGRLVMLLVLLIVVVMVLLWLAQRVYLFVLPRANDYLYRLLTWSGRHPWLGKLSGTLVDPEQPEARGLLVFGLILLASAWTFFRILHGVLGAPGATPFDNAVYQLLQGLRTPWADRLMVLLTELGDPQVYVTVTLALLAWLLLRGRRSAAAHLLGAVGFGVLLSQGLKYALKLPRPPSAQLFLPDPSFPSGHATISMVLYGFLAVLLARELSGTRRWLPYLCAGLLILPIAISRLYLGAHWLSDVLGGLTLGLGWVALLGIAYRRHAAPAVGLRGLIAVTCGALLLAGGVHVLRRYDADLQRYTVRHTQRMLAVTQWWDSGWQKLPAWRADLRGHPAQPLTVQWAGTLNEIRARLSARGWRAPIDLDPATALLWLSPQPQLAQLPVLPQVHDGRHESLRLTHPGSGAATQYVLRLWPADVTLDPGHTPLWIGNVSEQVLTRSAPLFTYPRSTRDFDRPLTALLPALQGLEWRQVWRGDAPSADHTSWNGGVVMVREARPGALLAPAGLQQRHY